MRTFLLKIFLSGIIFTNSAWLCGPDQNKIYDPPSACALLTEEMIRAYFEIPIEINIINVTRESSSYSSCKYTWESDTVKEITVAGNSYKVKAENTIVLTISEIGDLTPEVAYKQSVAPLRNNPHHDILDLGQKAVWIPRLNQLSVLAKSTILHVVLENYDAKNNKSQAVEFTKILIQKL